MLELLGLHHTARQPSLMESMSFWRWFSSLSSSIELSEGGVFALTLRNVRLGIALGFEQALFVVHVLILVIVAGLAGVENVPFSLLDAWITLLVGLISLNVSWSSFAIGIATS